MEATFDGAVVRADERARERFYDSRGYGRPDDGALVLAPVEAAHLLFRGDLDAVVDERAETDRGTRNRGGRDGERLAFRPFLATAAVSEVAFYVYKDLRDRGFYLAPDSRDGDGDGDGPAPSTSGTTFEVYPRGSGPWDDAIAYRVRPISERASVTAEALLALADASGVDTDEREDERGDGSGHDERGNDERGDDEGGDDEGENDEREDDDPTGVLAVVDEESELTYLEVSRPTLAGSTFHDLPEGVGGDLLADRVLVPDPPAALHNRAFYGQRMDDGADALQLSLVEAAYLAGQGTLDVEGGQAALVDRGREVEGERFDRRLRTYSALRTAGVVPKTGFKFGADFRTYADVESVAELGHSELLVRVLGPDHDFSPIDLALDVRLAHGVRKQMVYALTGAEDGIEWLSVARLTP